MGVPTSDGFAGALKTISRNAPTPQAGDQVAVQEILVRRNRPAEPVASTQVRAGEPDAVVVVAAVVAAVGMGTQRVVRRRHSHLGGSMSQT